VFFSNKEGKLTGASDLLLNSDVSYFKEFSKDCNLMATVTYNYFSDRIYALGTSDRGNLVDKAVGTLDLILRSKITKNIGLGLTVKNILDPTIERIQDKQNVSVESYKKGTNFKFSITYKF
jgi:outer membrane receptor protein involved in Fe transport